MNESTNPSFADACGIRLLNDPALKQLIGETKVPEPKAHCVLPSFDWVEIQTLINTETEPVVKYASIPEYWHNLSSLKRQYLNALVYSSQITRNNLNDLAEKIESFNNAASNSWLAMQELSEPSVNFEGFNEVALRYVTSSCNPESNISTPILFAESRVDLLLSQADHFIRTSRVIANNIKTERADNRLLGDYADLFQNASSTLMERLEYLKISCRNLVECFAGIISVLEQSKKVWPEVFQKQPSELEGSKLSVEKSVSSYDRPPSLERGDNLKIKVTKI